MIAEIDFGQPVKGPSGQALTTGGEDNRTLCLGDLLCTALLGTWKQDCRSQRQKFQDTKTALEAMNGPGCYASIGLSDHQRMHLKDLAYENIASAHLFTQVCEALGFTEEELSSD